MNSLMNAGQLDGAWSRAISTDPSQLEEQGLTSTFGFSAKIDKVEQSLNNTAEGFTFG